LHTNCGKECAQGAVPEAKHLNSKGKAWRAEISGSRVRTAPPMTQSHPGCPGWYSPIAGKAKASRPACRAVRYRRAVATISACPRAVLFFTNFVEKIVSKDLDRDQSPRKQTRNFPCSIFRQGSTDAHWRRFAHKLWKTMCARP
jgi:hypothetical protein